MYLTSLSCCVKYYDRTLHNFDMKTLLRVCLPPLEQTMKQTTGQKVEKPNEDLSSSSSNAGNNFPEPRFTS